MSVEEHRIYFSSDHCVFENESASFTVNLPFPLQFTGKWKCTIRDIFIKLDSPPFNCVYILADFCATSLIHENGQIPILKKLYLNPDQSFYSFTHPLYIPVKQTVLSNFNLSLLNNNLKSIHLDKNFLLECTIHFYKHGR